MTLNELFFDDSKLFHLKILEALPKQAIIQVGPDDAKNTVIEFMDYFCGYCKKIQPELIDLTQRRNDTRVVFLQHPILSENSKMIAEMVIAANFQNKGIELHNGLFAISGNLTQEKLDQLITNLDINRTKLRIDMGKDEIKNLVKLSSFLAMGSGARGTPSLFFNEEFLGGYVPINQLERFLK
ncbi:DsbA family protein [Pelagibacteraceae bacterium]|nr:DsbA family protein [Pelagibacteraceae bacterium]